MSQAAGLLKSQLPERIFDYFVTVELQPQVIKEVEQVVAVVIYRYPLKNTSEKDNTINSIAQFCFPGDLLVRADGIGRRSEILDEVELRSFTTGKNTVPAILESILASRFPLPGQSIEFPVVSWKQAGVIETLRFTRPDDDEILLDYVSFTPLLQLLDPETILNVFAALVIERRVIFVSERLSTLSCCVQALMALLYPFSWQHVYIPVLPSSLLTMCCAPMPFVVGILSSALPEVSRLPLDEVLMLDIDHNKFLLTPGNDFEMLPSAAASRLFRVLKFCAKQVKRSGFDGLLGAKEDAKLGKDDSILLTNEFANFFVELLKDYPKFMPKSREGEFDKEAFVKSGPIESRDLLRWVTEGQMFERWIAGKKDGSSGGGSFERQLFNRKSLGRPLSPPKLSVDTEEEEADGKGFKGLFSRLLRPADSPSPSPVPPSVLATGPDGLLEQQPEIIKKGYLSKLGSFKRWTRKWFVLDLKYLSAYPTRESRTPSDRMALTAIARVSKADAATCELYQHDPILLIEMNATPGGSAGAPPLRHYIRAETKEENNNWLAVLSTWIDSASHSAAANPSSSKPPLVSHSSDVGHAPSAAAPPAPSHDASLPSPSFVVPKYTPPPRPVPVPPGRPSSVRAESSTRLTQSAEVLIRPTAEVHYPPPDIPKAASDTTSAHAPSSSAPARPPRPMAQSSSLTQAITDYPAGTHVVGPPNARPPPPRRRESNAESLRPDPALLALETAPKRSSFTPAGSAGSRMRPLPVPHVSASSLTHTPAPAHSSSPSISPRSQSLASLHSSNASSPSPSPYPSLAPVAPTTASAPGKRDSGRPLPGPPRFKAAPP